MEVQSEFDKYAAIRVRPTILGCHAAMININLI
jgi:hypothetical protein